MSNRADYRSSRGGLLLRLHAPHGGFHLGWSRSDKTLCGRESGEWPSDSVRVTAAFCASCVAAAKRQMPHLQFSQAALAKESEIQNA